MIFTVHRKIPLFFIWIVFLFSGCQTYRQNILFRTDTEIVPESIKMASLDAAKNYQIQINDYLQVEVFTNKGERIIDPNYELSASVTGNPSVLNNRKRKYMVKGNGKVNLPITGEVSVAGLTLEEANQLLEKEFSRYYNEVYVMTQYVNKRIIVLGANGGRVIPLENENTNLIEVLAHYGGLQNNAKGNNIRLIRGDLNDPEVRLIDLTTIDGMKKANLKVHSGDIIYVEPVRKPLTESLRDLSPVLGFVTSLTTLTILLINLAGSGS